ncbi:MAG: hypothetical protein AB7E47_01715 [Desulfovibrionaceae bacterium]
MPGRCALCAALLAAWCVVWPGMAQAKQVRASAQGYCAIAGVTAEEAQHLAVRRARAAAVETAAGVAVSSSTLVTDGRLAGAFIKSLAHGYIVHEAVEWEPVGQYQPDPSRPPLIEYRVRLDAVVETPDGPRPAFGLDAALNQSIFRARKDALSLRVSAAAPVRVAVFNIMANDAVVMLYPDDRTPEVRAGKGLETVLPVPDSGVEMRLDTLPGHKRDTEAVLVAALPAASRTFWSDVFVPGKPMGLTDFFARYARLAGEGEDVILTYEVFTDE